MNLFGHHIPPKTLWIAAAVGGVLALVLYLRARASAAAGTAAAPQPDQGAGMTVAAPSGTMADQYQEQLNNADLQAQTIANQYQSNLVTQQQKQFDLQQSIASQLVPDVVNQQRAALSVQTHFDTAASKAAVSCPGSASLRTGPDGQLYCRQKTSGGFLGIPLGDIGRTVQNFVGGVEAAAPTIGYQTAQQAASYYAGQLFSPKPAAPARPVARTPGIAPGPTFTDVLAPHGYPQIG
jgi:hypothetical protein